MKKIIVLSICIVFMMPVAFCQEERVSAAAIENPIKIRPYWFVMLSAGPKYGMDSSKKAKLMAGHMENINRLHKYSILKVAGPFGKNDLKWKGIFILDCPSKEDAEKHVKSDPAVAAGLFEAEIVEWLTVPSGSFKHGKPEEN